MKSKTSVKPVIFLAFKMPYIDGCLFAKECIQDYQMRCGPKYIDFSFLFVTFQVWQPP